MLKKAMAGLAITAAMLAQPAPPALNTPAIEAYIRHWLLWPASVQVTLSAPSPSPLPGFFAVTVHGSFDGTTKDETFFVSADSQTIVRGEVYSLNNNPFQANLDLLKTDHQPFLGKSGAPVSIIEFGDFQCPYCKEESGVVRNQLMEAFPNDLQLFYLDYPLDTLHPFARGAAVLGRCIYTQSNSAFWAYHDWIFEHQSEITPANLKEKVLEYAATDKDLDVSRLTACAVAPEPRAEVDRSVAIGDALNINATPTFFINGRRMVGAVPLEDLKLVVEEELAYVKSRKKDSDCCSVTLSLPGAATGAEK